MAIFTFGERKHFYFWEAVKNEHFNNWHSIKIVRALLNFVRERLSKGQSVFGEHLKS